MIVDPGLATVLIALLAFLGTLVTVYLSYRTQVKLTEARIRTEANFAVAQAARHRLDGKVDDLHDATNSRLTEFIEAVRCRSLIEGRLLGIAEEFARSTAAAEKKEMP